MPLFLIALPLSFLTFWRYLLILPFLAVGAFLLSLLMSVPVLGMLIPGAVAAGLTLMGLRCALAARGHGGMLDIEGLPTLALVYSAIMLVGGLVGDSARQAIGWALRVAGFTLDPAIITAELWSLTPYSVTLWVALLLPNMMLASMLIVPMTAAAASGQRITGQGFLFGLGTGMLGLCIPFLVWAMLGNFLSFFGEVWSVFLVLAATLHDLIRGDEVSLDLWANRHILVSILGMTWASSWFFTTAVLYWERAAEREERKVTARADAARTSSADIRALRLAREQRSAGR